MLFKQFVRSRVWSSRLWALGIQGLFLSLILNGCSSHLKNTDELASKSSLDLPIAKNQESSDKKSSESSEPGGEQPLVLEQKAKEQKAETKGSPAQELTPELLYDLMLAELALQRNDYALAFDTYYNAAKQTRDSRLAKKATRVTLFSKNDDQTFQAVKLWSELQPDNIDVQQIYASSLISQKKDKEAIIHLHKIIELSENFDEGFKRSVAILEPVEERDRATHLFKQLSDAHSNKPIVQLYRAKLELKHGHYSASENYLNQALRTKPDYLDALLLKVDLLKKQKRPLQAIQTLKKILAKLPDNAGLRLELARMLVENNDYDEAYKHIKVLAEEDLAPEVLFAISLLSIEMGKMDDGRKYLERLHTHRLYASEAAYFIGQLEAGRNNFAEAEQWFKRVKHGKYTFEAYLGLAVVYSQQKKFDQAFKLLDHSKASTSKESIDVLQIKAEVYALAKNYTRAYEIYTEALSMSHNNHDLLYGRAMLAEKFGRIDLLEQDLHTIIAANPKDNQALNALGYTLADRTDRYQEAYGYIERAFKINPEDIATLDSMGWVLYKMGETQEAIKYLKKAYDKDPDPEIAAHYGEALWVLGQTQKAQAIWHKALKKDPEHRVLIGTTSRYLK